MAKSHDLRVLHSTGKDDWETPPKLFDLFNGIYSFTLDAAASAENRKCEAYLSKADNALRRDWWGRVWLNPPYSRDVGKWINQAARQVERGNAELVACLVYARTETVWWHDVVMRKASEIVFLRGRVRFTGAPAGAPAPSVVVVFSRPHRKAGPPAYLAIKVPR